MYATIRSYMQYIQFLDKQQVYVAHADFDEAENLQEGSVRRAKLSISLPNDYTEPIFDCMSSPAALDDSYCYSQDVVMSDTTPSPYSIQLSNTEHSYVNYVKPAENLSLLFNQIKQTNVKDILRSSIQ